MTARGWFVTGTDTGVGKTLVACGLARQLTDRGLRVGVMKPVETGCAEQDGRLAPEDALHLREAARSPLDIETICPFRFAEPVAPRVAAERLGQTIDPETLLARYREIADAHDVVVVEGAGGLLVPIRSRYTMADLAGDLGLPILVVAASRLGAINHTLLTLACAAERELEVAAYVLNHISEAVDTAIASNATVLQQETRVRCAGSIPFASRTDGRFVERAAALVGQSIDIDGLLSRV